ncbi:metal ABC transporter solute-binding protein, Zn/Mn family [Psychrobacillus sp. OK032]|uniref:metal ABC transporter solute-binding protein, Zn/Mn family n=1 Tax=Psychrobacillus sp. OK032 TaxID=1884358 RepID=UPI0008C7D761|nr:zinc ABC transporter substrate-binding protein [Psychrobacillus sp. OK032]SER93004.1 zinc transport system substrate-binding protein [Psychrobacillus sp. OK032]
MKKSLLLFLVLLLVLFTAACGNEASPTETTQEKDDTVQVYTTVYPLQYFAERIGGEAVNVNSIYPAGANEHTFEPTQKDMMALADADLFFYIGLGLEGFVENAKKTLAGEHVKMIATIDAVPEDQLEASTNDHEHEEATEEEHDHEHEEATEEGHEGHGHGDTDPHVWISPKISQNLALSIKNEFVETAPEQKETFEKNYEQLISELQKLDADFEEMALNAPNKTFFVSHAAFGYFANTYGLEQIAVAGLNSQDEPSQKELTKMIDLANEKNIKYILFEQNVSSKLTEVIQQEVGAESLVLHNLGVLSKEDVANNETYFTLMKRNLNTLKTVLK